MTSIKVRRLLAQKRIELLIEEGKIARQRRRIERLLTLLQVKRLDKKRQGNSP